MSWTDWIDEGDAPAQAPVFIEGLPGIGHVGQLAAQHLVDSLEGKPWARIHSPDFPPQAIVHEDGTTDLCSLRLWSVPANGDAPPLVILTGDTQPLSPQGQYFLAKEILQRVQQLGATQLYTLGGVLGRKDGHEIVGAGSNLEAVAALKEAGLVIDPLGPEGGILGASGVFLGLGKVMGFQGGCLMAASDGSIVDEEAAERLIAKLGTLLGRDIPMDKLSEVADRIESQLQAFEEVRYFAAPAENADHHYIG